MRLLFLSNFYPPYGQGGYEQWCQEIAEGLAGRGHEILVLTSRHGACGRTKSGNVIVSRELYLEMDLNSRRNIVSFFSDRKPRIVANLSKTKQELSEFGPDAVVIWGMWNLPWALPALLEEYYPEHTIYYIGDYWPTLPSQHAFYWQAPGRHWITRLPKHLLRPIACQMLTLEKRPELELFRTIFPTAFLRDELQRRRVPLKETKIIYGAVDTRLFADHNGPSRPSSGKRLSLLYVGRLEPDKGVHTAIEALSILVHQQRVKELTLTIVGAGSREYEEYLRKLAQQQTISQFVTFRGAQPKHILPNLYRQSDVLLFTSIWQEPFGRVLIEAMANGVLVVGSGSGGAAEILLDGENALVFAPGDAAGLASQIARLTQEPLLQRRLAENGRRTAIEKFDISRMTIEIEQYLQEIVA